jgi:hypothetical protein
MLQKLGFLPGFNKQVTETGAEGQWFDGDNVRFRYGSPEKIGGWSQLGQDKLTGAGRDATFEDQKFMVTSVPSFNTFTITMASVESGTPLSSSGSASALLYYHVGPSQQLGGFGWGTANYGGTANGPATTTLSTALTDLVTTDIVLASSTAFPSSGEIRIGTEDISFTNNDTATGTLSGGARGVNGTTKARRHVY